MTTRLKVLIGLLLLAIAAALGRYTTPTKVVTVTQIQTKVVTVVQHDITTVTKEITKPDGTKEVDTVSTDKSVDTSKEDQTVDQTKTVSTFKPQWHVSTQFSPKESQLDYFYGVQVDHRILGPVFVGAFGNADHNFGVNVGLEF